MSDCNPSNNAGNNCTVNGASVPCGLAQGVIESGAGVQCPNNVCQGVRGNGQPVYYFASAEGGGYFSFSGPGAMYYTLEGAGGASALYKTSASLTGLREYYGAVYGLAGVYSFTPATAGPACGQVEANGFGYGCKSYPDPEDVPDGAVGLGTYHTHPNADGFSGQDEITLDNQAATLGRPIWGFLAPAGRPSTVIEYNPISNSECVLIGSATVLVPNKCH